MRARERHSSLLVEETRLSDLFSRALDLKKIGPEAHSDLSEILSFNVNVAIADFNRDGWPDVVFRNQYGIRRTERQIDDLTDFGILTVFLACIWGHALLSYSVARLTSELGIRLALGLRRGRFAG